MPCRHQIRSSKMASQPHITDWRNFDPKRDLQFQTPKANSHRGFGIGVRVKGPDGNICEMYHQTPVLRLPFAIGEMEGDYGKKYEATFSFPGYVYDENAPGQSTFPSDPEMEAYHEFLHNWDEFTLELATSKTQEWFKKKYSREVIQELYKHMLKDSTEPTKYSKLFRTKVPFRYDKFSCGFFDSKGNKVSSDVIQRGSKVVALVKTTQMWFAGKGFGVSHQVEQFMVMDEESFEGCAITVDGVHVNGDNNGEEGLVGENKRSSSSIFGADGENEGHKKRRAMPQPVAACS